MLKVEILVNSNCRCSRCVVQKLVRQFGDKSQSAKAPACLEMRHGPVMWEFPNCSFGTTYALFLVPYLSFAADAGTPDTRLSSVTAGTKTSLS
jgi:hypothetical protein